MKVRLFVRGGGVKVEAHGGNVELTALPETQQVSLSTPSVGAINNVPGAVTPEDAYVTEMGGGF